MAKIVFGFGSSHGPLLSTPPERWDLRAADDRKNPEHPFRGRIYDFCRSWSKRGAGERDFEKESSLEVRQERFERNRRAMHQLAEKVAKVDPDIIVVVGDDQHEWFHEDIQPSFTVYCGEQVINAAIDPEIFKTKSPGIAVAMSASHPPQDQTYPVPVELAHAIIEQAVERRVRRRGLRCKQRANARGPIGVGHAVGFIYRRIVRDRPVPVIPILLNTYFPPNRPTAKRCYQFGQSVGRAIAAWNGPHANKRVAICASGGISHFVVDEDFDRRMLTAIKNRDTKTIFAEPENMFLSGTSETKNWITVAGILSETDLKMKLDRLRAVLPLRGRDRLRHGFRDLGVEVFRKSRPAEEGWNPVRPKCDNAKMPSAFAPGHVKALWRPPAYCSITDGANSSSSFIRRGVRPCSIGILRGGLQHLAVGLDAVADERRRQGLAGFARQQARFEVIFDRFLARLFGDLVRLLETP